MDVTKPSCNCGREPGFHVPHGNCEMFRDMTEEEYQEVESQLTCPDCGVIDDCVCKVCDICGKKITGAVCVRENDLREYCEGCYISENVCKNCGYDMGSSYIHCGASEDGVCPECGVSE